jgi:hypothetical protein
MGRDGGQHACRIRSQVVETPRRLDRAQRSATDARAPDRCPPVLVRRITCSSRRGAIAGVVRVRDAGRGGSCVGRPGRRGRSSWRPIAPLIASFVPLPSRRGRSPRSLDISIFMPLSLRPRGLLRPAPRALESGCGRCSATRLLMCVAPRRAAPPRRSPRPRLTRCGAPALRQRRVDLLDVPLGTRTSRDRSSARSLPPSPSSASRSSDASGRRRTACHHRVGHPRGIAVDQRLQLGRHLIPRVRLLCRKPNYEVVDRPRSRQR